MNAVKKTFTYEEALALMPHVHSLTAGAVRQLEGIIGREFLWSDLDELTIPADRVDEYETVIAQWTASINGLGIEVKGLWLIDFDSGSGYYCWRYPEATLEFFHGYEEGFGGRVELN